MGLWDPKQWESKANVTKTQWLTYHSVCTQERQYKKKSNKLRVMKVKQVKRGCPAIVKKTVIAINRCS